MLWVVQLAADWRKREPAFLKAIFTYMALKKSVAGYFFIAKDQRVQGSKVICERKLLHFSQILCPFDPLAL